MKNKELIEELQKLPLEDEVWLPVWNGHVTTYGVVDYVSEHNYDAISNDFFGTPGRMDKRLFENRRLSEHPENEHIIMISSKFSEVPNKDVDFGDDDIDYEIDTINGEDGDKELVWKINKFEFDEERQIWHREAIGDCSAILWVVSYDPKVHILKVDNYQNDMHFNGRVRGIETLRNIIQIFKIDLTIWM